ncbi:lipoprotein [Pseudomonas syringae]|uniref:Lipoprotein n=1 Tax=Pseudomonas syringae TaxID=317 RepID=A0A0L1LPB5_PSESX|nr:lipoprotein [Pseudomonas syringae]
MDVRLPLTRAGLCLTLLLGGCSPSDEKRQVSLEEKIAQFEQSLETIEDPKLKDAVAELGGSLLLLERAQLKLDTKPVVTEYGEDALAVLKHYPTPQALVDTYINGLFVLHKESSSDYLTDLQPVFPFNFNIPGAFLFPHGLEWQSVTLSNKRVIPFQPEWSETDPGIQLSPSSSNLTNPDDLTVTYPFIEGLDVDKKSQPQPVSLQGKVEVIAPRRLYSFDLTKKDVGQTRTNDNLSVTLLKLDNNYAEIEFNNSAPLAPEVRDISLNPLIVQARDATGQFISRSGAINETAAQIAFYQKQLTQMQQQKAWSEAFEKQLDDEQRAFEKQQTRHYTKVYFNGPIDTVEVSLLDFSAVTVTHKDLNLPIRRFDPHTTEKTIQPLTLPVVVYDDQAATWLKGATLGEEQLKKSISISQSVDDPSAARIEFDHPRSFNDELLGTSFNPGESPVTFFTQDRNGQRDGPIELPPEAYQVDPIRGAITYDLNLFPETPAYAVGSMPQFLATVDQQMYDARQLPKGLELKGNALVVDLKLFPAQDWRFFAKDDSGNYLKEILSVSHDASAQGPALFAVHYFYGQPTRLETYQRTNLTTVQYGFEVKLDKAESGNLD